MALRYLMVFMLLLSACKRDEVADDQVQRAMRYLAAALEVHEQTQARTTLSLDGQLALLQALEPSYTILAAVHPHDQRYNHHRRTYLLEQADAISKRFAMSWEAVRQADAPPKDRLEEASQTDRITPSDTMEMVQETQFGERGTHIAPSK